MFGSSGTALPKGDGGGPDGKSDGKSPSPETSTSGTSAAPIKSSDQAASGEKRSGNGSPPGRQNDAGNADKKRRSSGVGGKASSLLASAKNSLNFSAVRSPGESNLQTPLQKLGKQDPALAVPQGQHNNSAGESHPGPRSTFHVGVWEDRNKKCRRTMEDTHAFLYNFLHTPNPGAAESGSGQKSQKSGDEGDSATSASQDMTETDNGYFAIFDGHAGTFAADWCGKKLHIILEEHIRKNPTMPIPELLDQSFTSADAQLEKLPVKNSGCTAAIAVLRWEDRVPVPSSTSATLSQNVATAAAAAAQKAADDASKGEEGSKSDSATNNNTSTEATHARLKPTAQRQRVLYTANVGDARIILCRAGKALRLSYDHKGSDENEGKRIASAGGLIVNNRVNGVLAVTRALGDTYMKDLVTGHPYTTETVIQPDQDEFIILACDGLWDVCSDQEAVDLVRNIQDPTSAAQLLVDHALSRFSTDNLSCMIVRFDRNALMESQNKENAIGVEGDPNTAAGKSSEADKIVSNTKQMIAEGSAATGASATNSAASAADSDAPFRPTAINGPVVEEEPGSMDDDDQDEDDDSSSATGSTQGSTTTAATEKSEGANKS